MGCNMTDCNPREFPLDRVFYSCRQFKVARIRQLTWIESQLKVRHGHKSPEAGEVDAASHGYCPAWGLCCPGSLQDGQHCKQGGHCCPPWLWSYHWWNTKVCVVMGNGKRGSDCPSSPKGEMYQDWVKSDSTLFASMYPWYQYWQPEFKEDVGLGWKRCLLGYRQH